MSWREYVTDAYHAMRAAQDERAEEYAKGYPGDLARFYSEVEAPVTFKDTLIAARGSRREYGSEAA